MGTAPIRVLVVDDSSFMRKALCGMLAGDSCIGEVETARNGEEALQKISSWKPDVVTLDIEMPVMNGLDALRKIMETHPMPVLMVSSLTSKGAEETLQALELGAVDFVPKQLDGVVTNIAGVHHELVAKVIAAAGMAGRIRPRRPGHVSIDPFSFKHGTECSVDQRDTGKQNCGDRMFDRRTPSAVRTATAVSKRFSRRHRDRTAHAEMLHQAVCRPHECTVRDRCA